MAIDTSAVLPSPEQVSQRLLKKVQVDGPPVDLARITSIWKNLAVVEEDLDGSGYLLPMGRLGAEIVINRNEPSERKRFTVAHELGHWVLGLICEKKLGEFKQPPGIPKATIEKWCDTFASNLLMPASLVDAWLVPREQPMLLDALLRACTKFDVSEEAFFIRVWEVSQVQVLTLKTNSSNTSTRSWTITKSHADSKTDRSFLKILEKSEVKEQLQDGNPIIFFSLRTPEGVVSVSGKMLGQRSAVLAVTWPRPAPEMLANKAK